MEEDPEFPSPHSPSPDPHNNRQITLALPIQTRTPTPSSSAAPVPIPLAGGREDCWTEEATATLIDAWSERYAEQKSRGILKQKQWEEVADIVNSNAGPGKPARTDVQCKNRIDTVKRKYKSEISKIASGCGPSTWSFFPIINRLLGTPNSNSAPRRQRNQPPRLTTMKRPVDDSESDSHRFPGSDSDSDSLPPPPPQSYHQIKKRFNSGPQPPPRGLNPPKNGGGGLKEEWSSSVRELSRVIVMFSEAYEAAESEKLEQMVEMEKQRMKYAKEIELQRMKFLMKTQMQLSRLSDRRQRGGEGGGGGESNHQGHANNNVINNNNNSDCST